MKSSTRKSRTQTPRAGAVSAAMLDAMERDYEQKQAEAARPVVVRLHEPTPGPLPLRMDASRDPEKLVIVTNQGNHYATTYDPAAARLILAGPELLAVARIVEECREDGWNFGTLIERLQDAARAAIARAEGR